MVEYAGFVMKKVLKPLLVVPRLASLKLVIQIEATAAAAAAVAAVIDYAI